MNLNVEDYNCVAVVTSSTYNSDALCLNIHNPVTVLPYIAPSWQASGSNTNPDSQVPDRTGVFKRLPLFYHNPARYSRLCL